MYLIETKLPGGRRRKDGPFATVEAAQARAASLPGYGDPEADMAIIDLASPVFYKDAPHWALRRLDGPDGGPEEYVCARRPEGDYCLVARTRAECVDLAARAGLLEWAEPAEVTPSALGRFRRFTLGGHFYAL